jgi:hypothetical protein
VKLRIAPQTEMNNGMADRGDVFLREVDEELRREQITKLFERYGVYIIGVAVLILVGIGGTKWWQYRTAAEAEATGARFHAAAQLAAAGKSDEALASLSAITADGGDGYRALARLRAAGGLSVQGKTAEAVARYEALAADAKAEPLLRDYATLQAALSKSDSADWAEMETRLGPLLAGTSPWRSFAREARALSAMKAGKSDIARQELESLLGDRTVPAALGERVQLLLVVLTDQEAAKAAPQPAPAPAGSATPAPTTGKSPPPATKKQ